jgi:hypothetical protein
MWLNDSKFIVALIEKTKQNLNTHGQWPKVKTQKSPQQTDYTMGVLIPITRPSRVLLASTGRGPADIANVSTTEANALLDNVPKLAKTCEAGLSCWVKSVGRRPGGLTCPVLGWILRIAALPGGS